jgi:hypothetical protein
MKFDLSVAADGALNLAFDCTPEEIDRLPEQMQVMIHSVLTVAAKAGIYYINDAQSQFPENDGDA